MGVSPSRGSYAGKGEGRDGGALAAGVGAVVQARSAESVVLGPLSGDGRKHDATRRIFSACPNTPACLFSAR